MLKTLICSILCLGLAATAASAQANAPQGAPAETGVGVADLANLTLAMSDCQTAGYEVVRAGSDAAFQAYLSDHISKGETADSIVASFNAAMDQQQAAFAAVKSEFDNPAIGVRTAMGHLRTFVQRRCRSARARFPAAFGPSADADRYFEGAMGLWLDDPLVDVTYRYLNQRGACSQFADPLDPQRAIERLSSPFSDLPRPAIADLRRMYLRLYRAGVDQRPRNTAEQCERSRRAADLELAQAWSDHYRGSPPPLELR